jgi:hypothetical protein
VAKVNKMLNKIVLVVAVLLMMVNQGASTVSVNETVGEFRISFEVKEDIDLILRAWGSLLVDEIAPSLLYNLNLSVKDSYVVATEKMVEHGNVDNLSLVSVLTMNNPVNTSDFEMEVVNNSSKPYIRVYDRTIDGHKGIYLLMGDQPDDPNMEYYGLYWIDEAEDGRATELILVKSMEAKSSSKNVFDTVHVEKI